MWDISLITALGVGLLIGIVRERTQSTDQAVAGVRTHTLVALAAYLAFAQGAGVYLVILIALGLLAYGSYRVTSHEDPGLTGEIALLVNALLAGLAHTDSTTAAALGVAVVVLLYSKSGLRHLSRYWLAEGELSDVLMVAAAALVVLPMLPVQPLDPWGVVRLDVLWRVVVLIMFIAVLGHWAERLLGARWGLPVAGFFAGWVSSTASVVTLGNQVRAKPDGVRVVAASALLANLASAALLLGLVGTASPALLRPLLWPFFVGGLALLVWVFVLLWRHSPPSVDTSPAPSRVTNLRRATALAVAVLGVSLVSAMLDAYLGQMGVLVGSVLMALAELHSAAIGIAQLVASGRIAVIDAQWFIMGALSASVLAKSVLAFASGGRIYGWQVMTGLILLMFGSVGCLFITSRI